jgi:digeranylgeranylglycerophospholipid reductase
MKGAYDMAFLGPLQNGGRVIIIGGGPGGVSCALALHHISARMGKKIDITILENKEFVGERQYNQCVGVLSPPIATLLEEHLGLSFPFHLQRELIKGYVLHAGRQEIALAEKGEPSIALRRIQFDAYMLEAVKKAGIQVVQARAVDLEFYSDSVVVYTDSMPIKGDVVVGAWGMDDGSATLFKRVTGYQHPQALSSIVTKYHPGEEGMAKFGSYIHVFLPRHHRIEFGGVTPKGNHLTINIAGKTVDSDLMNEYLEMPLIRHVLPNFSTAEKDHPFDFKFFKGRFPCSLAKKYYGDRYVIIGDAAGLVRAFKGKGVTSAVLTGTRAAEIILTQGISEACFSHYYQAANQDIIRDFPYGRMMRFLTILMSRLQLFDPVLRAGKDNNDLKNALFDAVSAHDSYRNVFLNVMKLRTLRSILIEMTKWYLEPFRRSSHLADDPFPEKKP